MPGVPPYNRLRSLADNLDALKGSTKRSTFGISTANVHRPLPDATARRLRQDLAVVCSPQLSKQGAPAHLQHGRHVVGVQLTLLEHLASMLDGLDGLSTKGSTSKLMLNILGSIAQFERNLMLERTRAGLAAAKAKGRVGGRPRRMGSVARSHSATTRMSPVPSASMALSSSGRPFVPLPEAFSRKNPITACGTQWVFATALHRR
jgi:hypothetical protein